MKTHIYTTPTSVVCIDEETGRVVWQLTTKQSEAGEKMVQALRNMIADIGSWKECEDAIAEWEDANK